MPGRMRPQEDRGSPEALDARRLKQAIRFLHRDSADLLPLDGLKKLGTSKQGQPHTILQKRLLESQLSQGRMRMCVPANGGGGVLLTCVPLSPNEDEREEDDLIYVACKCSGQEVNVLIDTGCRLNLVSWRTVERFGLKELVGEGRMERAGSPFQRPLPISGHIQELGLTIGRVRLTCSFAVVESSKPLMSLGSNTLKSLKCVIDTEKQMLVFGKTVREQIPFTKKPFN
ncbi:unnamed protein product [Menidia menidia]|uniref:(Atlantic silverside) hypothetical protein n=1 Tax=Menidia menidia TaxID=238744 RepID=A0A8S4BF07_9TELE|nr:unnamed protein product [Menidia menidia]